MKQAKKAVRFCNFSDEKFTCSWDSVEYTFQPKQEMFVEEYLAHHFAKHLINRELDKKGIITSNMSARKTLLALAIPEDTEVVSETEMIDLNEQKRRGRGRPPKNVEEKEFAELI